MAFSSAVVSKNQIGSIIIEKQSYSAASTTTGTLTCDTSIQPEVTSLITAIATDSVATHQPAVALGTNTVTLSGLTSGDTGTVTFIGFAR